MNIIQEKNNNILETAITLAKMGMIGGPLEGSDLYEYVYLQYKKIIEDKGNFEIEKDIENIKFELPTDHPKWKIENIISSLEKANINKNEALNNILSLFNR